MGNRIHLLLLVMVGCAAGCGPSPVVGGTSGSLQAGGAPLGDVQVKLHQADGTSWRMIGFADSAADGTFQLVTNGARGPLQLAPGEYRCTLESVGAPVLIPPAYAQAETTPLRVSWDESDRDLSLVVPERLLP
jgi:hypothetical protein